MQERYRRMYLAHAGLGSFEKRISLATARIGEFLAVSSAPYVAFSGGKDSTCLLILLAALGRTDVPVFTQGDDLDWPDKEPFCRRVVGALGFTDYTYMRSDNSALDQFARLALDGSAGVRGTFSHVVRRYVEERQRDGVIMGLRAEESVKRRARRAAGWMYRVTSGEVRAIPIADLSGLDVFALILSRDVPYFHVYDADSHCPPHDIRMSWMVNPEFLQFGHAAILKRHYPEQFRRLCEVNPNLRCYA